MRIELNLKVLSKLSDKELKKKYNSKTTPTLDYVRQRLGRKDKEPKKEKKGN